MKKLFTILTVVALTTTISFAQVQWGAAAGLNMANVSYSGSGDYDTDMRLGIRLGITADITLSDAMTLNTGALYSVKGYSQTIDFSAFGLGELEMDQSYNYIEIPLHVSYAASDAFSIMAGPYLAILAGTSATLDGEDMEATTDGMAAMDFGLTLGTSFSVSETISINAAYQMGLSQLDEDGNSDLYNTNILIGMSYSFGG